MTKSEIRNLQDRVSQLQPPQHQEPFASRKLVQEMKNPIESLTKKRGRSFLVDPYGRDYLPHCREAIRKGELRDYRDADEFAEQLTPDEALGLARLIHEMEKEGIIQ